MTHIDTAEMYGAAEELVAEAIDGDATRCFSSQKSFLTMRPGMGRLWRAKDPSLP